MIRIIDGETNLFIRDDFTFDEETEIGLDVEPAQGFYKPKWDFESEMWIEGLSEEEIEAIKNSVVVQPSENEMLRDYVLELDMRMIMLEFGL